jgi:lipid A oxidase
MILASPAAAEMELGLYMGTQSLPHSRLTGDVAGTPFDRLIGWEGKSFDMPPYWGAKAAFWRDNGWGWGLEYTHTKAYAPDSEMAPEFSRLEFTDGHNLVTLNVHRRWQGQWMDGKLTPFVTGGVGLAFPHVDIQPTYAGAPHTYGYQVTGPAVRLGAGVSYALTDRINLYSEYQFTWSDNEVDLDGGGTLNTEIKTNALNFGVTYKF